MGYFDNIKKTGISVEKTRERMKQRTVSLLLDDIKNCMNVRDGMKVGTRNRSVNLSDQIVGFNKIFDPDYDSGSSNPYDEALGNGIDTLIDNMESYCDDCDDNRKMSNPSDLNKLSIRLPKSEFAEEAGTDILFGFDSMDTVKKIQNERMSNSGFRASYNINYGIFGGMYRAEIHQNEIQIYSQYMIELDSMVHTLVGDPPEKALEDCARGRYDESEMKSIIHDILLKNINPKLYMTEDGKISMQKLLTNYIIENKNLGDSGGKSFKESNTILNNLIETNFSRQPIYEHTGTQIPVKCNTEVLIADRILQAINKIINRLPDMFDGQPLEKNFLTI